MGGKVHKETMKAPINKNKGQQTKIKKKKILTTQHGPRHEASEVDDPGKPKAQMHPYK